MDTTDSAYGDKLIRLDTFDTAVAVDPSAEDDAKRRFMTLILQTAHRNNGNIGHVLRATNTSGEVFAVKLLKDNAILSGQAPDRSAEQAAAHLANTAALFEEYRHLCTVSHLRGFPRVYGYGSCEDDPLILMEWVEGTSLKQALPLLPHDASGGLTTQMVAAVGNAVLRALLMTQGLVNPVVHRDLSPANIMFRTTSRTLEQQIVDCSFDPCLIDMGSATMALGDDTITRRADIWRFATPAYAAPEMLTQDIEGIAALRRSPAIDVYALSSILYQLYSGRKPFDVESTGAAATGSFYLIKTKTKPAPLEPRCSDDEALVQIIMKGISVEQRDRPTEQQMLEVLSAYLTDAESGLATLMWTVPGGAQETGGPYMRDPRHPRHFTDEFKRQIVDLYNAGKPKREIMDEYDLGKSTVERWIKSINATGSPRAACNRTPEQNRILELERENRRLRMEVDVLKQAALIYARK